MGDQVEPRNGRKTQDAIAGVSEPRTKGDLIGDKTIGQASAAGPDRRRKRGPSATKATVLSQRRRNGGPPPRPSEDAEAPIAPIQFRLESSREVMTTPAGERLTGRGYRLCDPGTGARIGEEDFFFRIGGGIVTDLVVAPTEVAKLQNRAFGPGKAMTLVRHAPVSSDEPAVVEVFDLTRTIMAGRLPPDAADLVSFHGDDSYQAALCLWEWRAPDGARVGLRLLLAPGWSLEELPERTS